jgi:hypothetical protein
MIFNLIQNWKNEYPQFEPYEVIAYTASGELQGYSACDEYGRTDFLPSAGMAPEPGSYSWYRAANEETANAFLGEKKVEDGKTWLKVIFDKSVDPLKG